ncbi:hypothetical protein [Clostridium cochlearium]|uniref:hypothetical protein n=2 Tax=Clostridium cochlearium TaxID=1494 RepID=UPI001A9A4E29|nr:hypothetical protein [Clostridium cochlearium]
MMVGFTKPINITFNKSIVSGDNFSHIELRDANGNKFNINTTETFNKRVNVEKNKIWHKKDSHFDYLFCDLL